MKGITGPKKDEIINRQLCHFFRADAGLGMRVAEGLGIDQQSLALIRSGMEKEVVR